MPDRRLTTVTALVAFALVAVIAVGATVGASSTARTLTPQVEQAMVVAGLEDVQVDVRGREVSLRDGTLGELTEAVRVARGIIGVRQATIDARPGSVDRLDTSRPYLRLRRDPDRLRILGMVPGATVAATMKSSAARAFGVPVRGDVGIDPSLPPARWTAELPAALSTLTDVTDLQLTIDGRTLRLSGSVPTAAERTAVLREIASAVPSLQIESTIQISRRVEEGAA